MGARPSREPVQSSIEVLPSPRGTSGEGPGEGPLAGASSNLFAAPHRLGDRAGTRMASILARFLRSRPARRRAVPGLIVRGPKFLFDGAWLGATPVSFVTCCARMRPATAADARPTLVLSEHG